MQALLARHPSPAQRAPNAFTACSQRAVSVHWVSTAQYQSVLALLTILVRPAVQVLRLVLLALGIEFQCNFQARNPWKRPRRAKKAKKTHSRRRCAGLSLLGAITSRASSSFLPEFALAISTWSWGPKKKIEKKIENLKKKLLRCRKLLKTHTPAMIFVYDCSPSTQPSPTPREQGPPERFHKFVFFFFVFFSYPPPSAGTSASRASVVHHGTRTSTLERTRPPWNAGVHP